MLKLTLLPGPVLQLIRPEHCEEPEITDVTAQAYAHLYRALVIAPDVRLSDVLGLLHACPTLIDIYSNCNAQGIADAASLGPQQQSSLEGTVLEYLELCRIWDYDASIRTYSGLGFLDLSGVGPYSEDDLQELKELGAKPPCSKKRWCVGLTPVRDLLDLPMRLGYQIGWLSPSRKSRAKPRAIYCSEFLLGEVLNGLLSQLSWFGDADQQQDMIEMLEQAQSGPWTPLDLDALPS